MTPGPPRILFIDAATRFGWAFGPVGEKPASGSGFFAKTKGASQGAVFWGAMRFVSAMIQEHGADIEIVIEAPLAASLVQGHTNVDTTEILMGLPAAITGMAFGLGCYDVSIARVASIRKHFIGKNMKGEIAKPKVHRKCLDLGWVAREDEDQSFDRTDALAGWSYAEHKRAPRIAQPVADLFVQAAARGRARPS